MSLFRFQKRVLWREIFGLRQGGVVETDCLRRADFSVGLAKEILFFDPLFVKRNFFPGIDENHQKFASKMQNYIF